MVQFTKITHTVIQANSVLSPSIASNAVLERHIANIQVNTRHITTFLSNLPIANDYATYTRLNANINTVQLNLAAAISSKRFLNTNVSTSTSNVFFLGTPGITGGSNIINVYIDGIEQERNQWIFNSGNTTIQFIDNSLPSGLTIFLESWYV